jgi:CRP/FNR family transcriptional regulator
MTNTAERDSVQTRDGICDNFHEAVAAHIVYRPRQVVFAEGHPCTGLHFVCHGAVKLFHSDASGRHYVTGIAGPGAVLGDLGMDSALRQSISAIALTQSRLAFLPRERLERFVRANPGSAIRLITTLGRELAHTRRMVRDLALKGAEGRLASLLEQWARAASDRAPDTRIQLRYRRAEIAEMIGVSTETLIRLLAKLKRKGVISVTRREMNILDPIRLRRIATHGERQ